MSFSHVFFRPIWLVYVLVMTCTVQAGTVQLYILAGQSNMDGRADIVDLPPSLAQTQDDVQIYYVDLNYEGAWRSLEPGLSRKPGRFGPEVQMGRNLADILGGSNVRLIKVSEGGTSLAPDPEKQCWDPDVRNEKSDLLIASVADAINTLPAGETPVFAGFA